MCAGVRAYVRACEDNIAIIHVLPTNIRERSRTHTPTAAIMCLTVTCSSYQAIRLIHSYMFILPGYQFVSQLHVHVSLLFHSCMFTLSGGQFDSELHVHFTRPSVTLTVAYSSYQADSLFLSDIFISQGCQFVSQSHVFFYQAVGLSHTYMFILPGRQFDSKLHVHLTRPSVCLKVTCSSYQTVSLTQIDMFILPDRQFDSK